MQSSGWCPSHAICMDWIERRALECVENFIEPDSVYMSEDVYIEFLKQMGQIQRFSGPNCSSGINTIKILTSVGELIVKRTPHICNFCYVGQSTSAQRLLWEKVDKEFENIVILDGE